MHCNNSHSSQSLDEEQTENDLICLVLTDFPQRTNLNETKLMLEEQFSFVPKIDVANDFEIECYFYSMTDLIEIDQGRKYGAGRAFIRQINPQTRAGAKDHAFQKCHQVFQNSSQTFESDTTPLLPSYKFIPSTDVTPTNNTKIDPKLIHHPLKERLTSLQNEIQQLQSLRKDLDLYKGEIDWETTGETYWVEEGDSGETDGRNQGAENQDTDYSPGNSDTWDQCEKEFDQVNKKKKKQVIMSFVEGAALTVLLLGGFKLLRNIIG